MQFEIWKGVHRPSGVHIVGRLRIEVTEGNVGITDDFLLINGIIANRSGELCKLIEFERRIVIGSNNNVRKGIWMMQLFERNTLNVLQSS
jgi:hypothetical protein